MAGATSTERPLGLWEAFRGFSRDTQLFLLYTAITGVTMGIYWLGFNLYASATGLHNNQIGLLNAIPSVGMFAIGLPGGMLADRYGYKPFVLVSSCLMAVAPLAVIFFARGASLVVFTLLFGAGSSLIWVVSGPMLAAFTKPEDRVHLFSLNAFVMTASGALGNLLGGALPEWQARALHISANSATALHTTFIAMLVLGIITVALACVIHPPQLVARTVNPAESVADSPPRQDWGLFLRLIAPGALVGLGAGSFVTFQQLYFHQRFTLSPGPIASIFAISQVVTAVAILTAPWLANHLGRVRATVVTEAVSIPFLLVLAFSYNLQLALGAFYMRAALMNMGSPVSEALAMDMLPVRQRATYASVTNALGNLGRGGLGPAISGVLQSFGGYGAAFSFTALTYACAASLYFSWFRDVEPGRHTFGWLPGARAWLHDTRTRLAGTR